MADKTPFYSEALSDVCARVSLTVGGLESDAAVVAPLAGSTIDSMAFTLKDGRSKAWSKEAILLQITEESCFCCFSSPRLSNSSNPPI